MKEVTVYRTWDEPHAEMAADLLQSEGIPVRKVSEALRKVFGFTMDGLGQIELRVPEDYAERAAEIIAVRFSEQDSADTDIPE